MEKLYNSPAEILKTVEVQTIEQDCLDHVFKWLSGQDKNKDDANKDFITELDLARCLQFLGLNTTKSEVAGFIWEVDEDLDGKVSKEEYQTMYKRSISDKDDLEPRKLFNLVQFLMYDKTFKGKVTVEETLQILFVRHGRTKLDEEIKHIFGEGEGKGEKNPDGSEREITYGEYVESINTRALKKLEEKKKARKEGKFLEKDFVKKE